MEHVATPSGITRVTAIPVGRGQTAHVMLMNVPNTRINVIMGRVTTLTETTHAYVI